MLLSTCLTFTGCKEDIVKVELTISVYDYENEEFYDQEDTKLIVQFYRHLAPETVDTILSYVKDGYYDNTIFYSTGLSTDKILIGDLKMNANGKIVQNEIMPEIDGEFEYGTTKGSNLTVSNGNVALWRTWYSGDDYKTNAGFHTGRATWFMPTKTLSSYQGYFCVFAVMDLTNSTNQTTWDYIKEAVINSANTEKYQVYYTGEYQYNDYNDANNGLTFHCEKEIPSSHTVFVPEDDQLECYKQIAINVAKGGDGEYCGAKIVSARIL